jgi:hypothetical protein
VSVFILGPKGQMAELIGPVGTTPPAPTAKFKVNDVVRVRRLKHLLGLPEIAVVVAVVPPGFSPDWAWADLFQKPRPLMCQVGARVVKYIVAFEGDTKPNVIREAWLLPTNEPPANVHIPSQARNLT